MWGIENRFFSKNLIFFETFEAVKFSFERGKIAMNFIQLSKVKLGLRFINDEILCYPWKKRVDLYGFLRNYIFDEFRVSCLRSKIDPL